MPSIAPFRWHGIHFPHCLTTTSMQYYCKFGTLAHSSRFNRLQYCSILNSLLEVKVQVSWQSVREPTNIPDMLKIVFFRTSDIYINIIAVLTLGLSIVKKVG